jgi:carboxymethylenebutenolidase
VDRAQKEQAMCTSDDCGPGGISRRRLIAGATGAAADLALSSRAESAPPPLGTKPAPVPPTGPPTGALEGPAITQGPVTFPCGGETLRGYLAHPKGKRGARAVLVLHGNFGLPEVASYTAARLAAHGFAALALERFGRFPGLTPQALAQSDRTDRRFLSKAFQEQELIEALAAIRYLTDQPYARGQGVGVLGYCGGGVQALWLATLTRAVRAAAVFYTPPNLSDQYMDPRDPKPKLMAMVDRIDLPVQGHYGTADPTCPLDDVRRFEEALRRRGRTAEFYLYEGGRHAFCDYTRPYYLPEAAALGWDRSARFLRAHLS